MVGLVVIDKGRIDKETGGHGNKGISRDYPNNSIKIGQNTAKSAEDLSRLDVTQTPVRNYQLVLVGKTPKIVK